MKKTDSLQNINKVLVIVGPSGVGKDTLMQKLFIKYPNSFQKAITHTTRQMRQGEEEGKNYYYVSKEEFIKMKDNNSFVEFNYYNNNYYGLSKKELEKAKTLNKIMYLIIDINGANAINKLKIPANYFAFLPPNIATLEKRLVGRGTESKEEIQSRIKIAIEEIKKINKTPFFNCKIINDTIDKALNNLEREIKKLNKRL